MGWSVESFILQLSKNLRNVKVVLPWIDLPSHLVLNLIANLFFLEGRIDLLNSNSGFIR